MAFDKENNVSVPFENTANYINTFFTNIGPNLARKYDTGWDFGGVCTEMTLANIETNLHEIIKLCKDININKSSSIDNLSNKILRDAFMAIPDKVVDLFNLLFELAEVPDV